MQGRTWDGAPTKSRSVLPRVSQPGPWAAPRQEPRTPLSRGGLRQGREAGQREGSAWRGVWAGGGAQPVGGHHGGPGGQSQFPHTSGKDHPKGTGSFSVAHNVGNINGLLWCCHSNHIF